MSKNHKLAEFKKHLEKCTKLEVVKLHNEIWEDIEAYNQEQLKEMFNGVSEEGYKYYVALLYFVTSKDVLIMKMMEEHQAEKKWKQPHKEQ